MRTPPAFRESQVLVGPVLRLALVVLSAFGLALGAYGLGVKAGRPGEIAGMTVIAVVEVSLADGNRLIVGTRRPEELLQAIRSRLVPEGRRVS